MDKYVSKVPSIAITINIDNDGYKRFEVLRKNTNIGHIQMFHNWDTKPGYWDVHSWGREGYQGKVNELYSDTVGNKSIQEMLDVALAYFEHHVP